MLIAFAQWFMRMGVRFTFPNKLDVKVSLTQMLDGFQARCLVDVIRGLRDLIQQRRCAAPTRRRPQHAAAATLPRSPPRPSPRAAPTAGTIRRSRSTTRTR